MVQHVADWIAAFPSFSPQIPHTSSLTGTRVKGNYHQTIVTIKMTTAKTCTAKRTAVHRSASWVVAPVMSGINMRIFVIILLYMQIEIHNK